MNGYMPTAGSFSYSSYFSPDTSLIAEPATGEFIGLDFENPPEETAAPADASFNGFESTAEQSTTLVTRSDPALIQRPFTIWMTPASYPAQPFRFRLVNTATAQETAEQAAGLKAADTGSASAFVDVVRSYRELIGKRGLTAFTRNVLPMAAAVLENHPKLCEAVLMKLIDVASYLKPTEIDRFWKSTVTFDTFDFQRRYLELDLPRSDAIEGKVFHITDRWLLNGIKELIPKYIRDGEPFVPEPDDDSDYYHDYYRVCCAAGTIDQLSIYLLGHAMLSWMVKKKFKWPLEENDLVVSTTMAVAVVDQKHVAYKEEHTIETVYDLGGSWLDDAVMGGGIVRVHQAERITPIDDVITIPFTVITDDQIDELRQQGKAFYAERIATGSASPEIDIADPESAGDIFAAVKHHERTFKYAFIRYAERLLRKTTVGDIVSK